MTGENVTREELMKTVRQQLGLFRGEAAALVGQVLEEICATLAAGKTMKLSGFGTFTIREEGQRIGRNPKTGVEVPIELRRVFTFNPSPVLKAHINDSRKKPRPG